MGETDGQPKDADWAAPISGIPADTIRALARRMAATRTMITASWSLQRAHHGEQPYWAVVLLASALGQIGLPGGGFGFGYGSGAGIADAPLAFARARDGRHQESGQRDDTRRAHFRLPAASRRAVRLQRQAQHLSRYPAGVLGGRKSVPSSSGHQQAAARLCAARHHRGARSVVDRDRAPCRHRAAGDHVAGAQRHRRRAARPLHHGDASRDRAGRRGAQRLCDLQRAVAAARLGRDLHAGPRRECVAAAPLRSMPPQRRRQCRAAAGLRHVLGAGLSRNPGGRRRNTCCSAISAPIRRSTS